MNEHSGVDSSHVLILRLWSEPRTDADATPQWRALIEDVNTHIRYPIEDMEALSSLLGPHAHAMALEDFLASQNAQDER